MGEKNYKVILWVSAISDLVINLGTILFAFLIMSQHMDFSDFGKPQMAVTIGVTLFASIIYLFFSIYTTKRFEKLHKALLRTFFAQIIVYLIAILVIAIFATTNAVYYHFASVCTLTSLVLICTKRFIAIKLIHLYRKKRLNDRKIIVVGNSEGALVFKEQLEKNQHFGYNIIGCVCSGECESFTKLGEIEDLDSLIKEHEPYEIVIALDESEKERMQSIISVCDTNGIRVLIVPLTHKYFKSKCQIDMVGDLPVINTRSIPLDNVANAAIKRIMDIVISIIMIIITSPIMLFAIIGIKLSSPGPVIFKQKRVGKDNKIFTMYKFRSMKVNDMSDTAWTTDEDPRKTKFGTFLRKTGIDELPQFFNVLFGDMSIVGPRPEIPTYVEKYSKTIPLYRVKHQVKPGITGLAQIYGFRGNTSIEKRIELDIKYIENWSIFNDIKIILITPFKMFNRNEKYVK